MQDATPIRPVLPPITAISHVRGGQTDALLALAVNELRRAGLRVCGAIQHSRPGRQGCCDAFWLEDLATGRIRPISLDLGRLARGCRLDYASMAAAYTSITESLNAGADVLVVNRFGYSETQGRGLRPLIAHAVTEGISTLIAVDPKYRPDWDAFAAGLSRDVPAVPDQMRRFAQRVVADRPARKVCLD